MQAQQRPVEQIAHRDRVTQAFVRERVADRSQYYATCILNGKRMPRYSFCALYWMIAVREGLAYCPTTDARVIDIGYKPTFKQLQVYTMQTLLRAARLPLVTAEQCSALCFTVRMIRKRIPDKVWMLTVIHELDPRHPVLQRDYLPPPVFRSVQKFEVMLNNEDGFFDGLPVHPKNSKKRVTHIPSIERSRQKLEHLLYNQRVMSDRIAKLASKIEDRTGNQLLNEAQLQQHQIDDDLPQDPLNRDLANIDIVLQQLDPDGVRPEDLDRLRPRQVVPENEDAARNEEERQQENDRIEAFNELQEQARQAQSQQQQQMGWNPQQKMNQLLGFNAQVAPHQGLPILNPTSTRPSVEPSTMNSHPFMTSMQPSQMITRVPPISSLQPSFMQAESEYSIFSQTDRLEEQKQGLKQKAAEINALGAKMMNPSVQSMKQQPMKTDNNATSRFESLLYSANDNTHTANQQSPQVPLDFTQTSKKDLQNPKPGPQQYGMRAAAQQRQQNQKRKQREPSEIRDMS